MTTIDFSTRAAGGALYDVAWSDSIAWSRPQWINSMGPRLQLIARQRPDWDVRTAERAIGFLRGYEDLALPVPFVVDTVEGGTQLEWNVAAIGLELEFRPDGQTLVLGEDDHTGEERDGTIDQMQDVLSQLTKELANRIRG